MASPIWFVSQQIYRQIEVGLEVAILVTQSLNGHLGLDKFLGLSREIPCNLVLFTFEKYYVKFIKLYLFLKYELNLIKTIISRYKTRFRKYLT